MKSRLQHGNRISFLPQPSAAVLVALLSATMMGCSDDYGGRRTTLRVAHWGGPAGDPSFMKLERETLEEFERRHPGIRVAIENIPGPGQYVPKLLMTYVAGNPPDVITLDASSAAVFIQNSLLVDLSRFIRGDSQFDLSEYASNVLDIARRGDCLYAVPLDFTPMVLLYNKQLFDKSGLSYPKSRWTREEFLEMAKVLTVTPPGDASPARYGFAFSTHMPMWLPWIWAGGGDVLSSDGQHALGFFDSPETIEIIEFLADLVIRYRVAPSLSESAAAGVDLFRVGKAAMTLTGHWSLIEYRSDRMDIGVTSVPGSAGGHATVLYAAGLAISRASPNKEAAWQYIKYMTSESVQKKRVATGLAVSANMKVAWALAKDPIEKAFLDETSHAKPPWGSRVEQYELIEDLGREMMEDIVHGGLPVPDTVKRTAALIEAELRRH